MIDINAERITGELVEYRRRPGDRPSLGKIMAVRPPHLFVQIRGRSVAADASQLSWPECGDVIIPLRRG